MIQPLFLSANELVALLVRTFEGLCGTRCDNRERARQILWMEMHGLGGLDSLLKALPNLENCPSSDFFSQRAVSEETRLNSQGRNMVCCSVSIIDGVIGQTADVGNCHISIKNCDDPLSLIYGLSRLGASKINAAIFWRGREPDIIGQARVTCDAPLPDVQMISEAVKSELGTTVQLFAANDGAVLEKMLNAQKLPVFEPNFPASKLKSTYDACLDQGIEVTQAQYQELCSVADRVLVEASDESRRGAGD